MLLDGGQPQKGAGDVGHQRTSGEHVCFGFEMCPNLALEIENEILLDFQVRGARRL